MYPRTRTTDLVVSSEPFKIQRILMDGQTVSWTTNLGVSDSYGYLSTMQDEPHKGYHAARQAGVWIMSPCLKTRSEGDIPNFLFNAGPYNTVYSPNYGYQRFSGDIVRYLASLINWPTEYQYNLDTMKSVALTRAYKNISPPAVMSGEILNDLSRTIASLKYPFRSMAELFDRLYKISLRKSVVKSAKRKRYYPRHKFNQALSDTWLEMRYGFIPTAMDVHDICTAATKLRSSIESVRLIARGCETYDNRVVNDFSVSPVISGSPTPITGRTFVERSIKVASGVIYDTKCRTLSDQLLKTLGVRPSDLPGTLWQIVPFSFVVDWVANIGDWLQAVNLDPDVTVVRSWTTVVNNSAVGLENCVMRRTIGAPPYDQTYVSAPFSSTKKYQSYEREIDPVLPPQPAITFDGVGVIHSLDAITLSYQRSAKTIEKILRKCAP